jgi:hypothetical protein
MKEAFIEWVHKTRPGLIYYRSVLLRVSRNGDYLFTYWSNGSEPHMIEHTFRVSDFLPYWREVQLKRIGI